MLRDLWTDLGYRLRALFRRDQLEQELDAELRFHIERETEKLQRDGLPHAAALRRARLAFGGIDAAKEATRDARGTVLLESLLQDVRYAVRGLRTRPGFTAAVVLTLALGIGANAAMFSIVDDLLFRAPPFLRDADRVHRIYFERTVDRRRDIERSISVGRFLDIRRTTRSFSTVAAFATWHMAVGEGADVNELPVAGVSASYLDLFSARPALGRFFTVTEDSMPAGSPVVVLGHAYWESVFGSRRDVLGRSIRIGRMSFTIIGVAPSGFVGLSDDEVPMMYVPLAAFAWNARPEDHSRDYHWVWPDLVVKRTAGVSITSANADLTNAMRLSRLSEQPGVGLHIATVTAERPRAYVGSVHLARGPLAGPETKVATWVSGVAVVVLLIACANVANLLLARAITRRREIVLRLALGVSRGRLVRQLITEGLVLTMLGGSVGLAIARWGGAVIRALFIPSTITAAAAINRRTIAVTFVATVAVGILTGLAPAVYALGADLRRSFGSGSRDVAAVRSGLRSGLLMLQAAMSVVLLVGAGLFVRSFSNVRSMRLGYDVGPVVVVTEKSRGTKVTAREEMALEQRLSEAAAAIPGVVSATPAPTIPFWAFEGRRLFVRGIDSVSLLGDFIMQAGNPDYFRTMGTRIVRGRGFAVTDRADAPLVVVASDGMARVLWPGRDAIGQCVRIGADTTPCATVVGIAEDLHIQSLTERREFTYYIPIAQFASSTGMVLVRVVGDAADVAPFIRRQLQREMPGGAYVTAVPLSTMVNPIMQSWRLGATMFVTFGAIALALAAVGLYGVIAFGVVQRRREIGLRIALGAPTRRVLTLVMASGLRLVIAGVICGGVIALTSARWISGLLFNESPRDPVVYAAVAVVLVIVAIGATAVPAIAAARMDPNVTLRSD